MKKVKKWLKENWKWIAAIVGTSSVTGVLVYLNSNKSDIFKDCFISGPKEIEFKDLTADELAAYHDMTQYAISVLTTNEVYKDPPVNRELYDSAIRESMRWMLENGPETFNVLKKFFTEDDLNRIYTE